ncbi:SixA phosphatase family protein [Ciceribacter azotifigens]|uniref:SixA phosphatase family protein n=1 Tax=Ciceribacter azotifigens TaxID=2069303 RepID=UPI003A866C2E
MGGDGGRDATKVPRRLLLLRHAKSDWASGTEDYERPLAKRGRKAALLIADYLVTKRMKPDLALVSGARRTRETWAIVESRLTTTAEIRILKTLYDASAERILALLRDIDPRYREVLVLSHNPGLQEAALRLAGNGEGDALKRLREKFPTAALACILFHAEGWSQIGEGNGYLERFVVPRSLA